MFHAKEIRRNEPFGIPREGNLHNQQRGCHGWSRISPIFNNLQDLEIIFEHDRFFLQYSEMLKTCMALIISYIIHKKLWFYITRSIFV
jgi:hypothetical protein